MAFSYMHGQMHPANYSYDNVPINRNVRVWHVAAIFAGISLIFGGITASAINSNIELIGSQSVTVQPELNAQNSIQTTPQSSVPVAPAVTPVVDKSPELQADVEAWISAHKGAKWAVQVREIDGDLSASVASEEVFSLASIYKLFLIQPLTASLPSDKWDSNFVASRTYTDCVDAMIRVSDNFCALAIGNKLGWSKSQTVLRGLGYKNTSFISDTTKGTASDTTLLLANLYNSNGFDKLTRTIVMDAMLAPKVTEGIRRGCDGCQVYNKIGDLAGYHNDAAIVIKGNKAYSVVIMSKSSTWQQMADLTIVISKYL